MSRYRVQFDLFRAQEDLQGSDCLSPPGGVLLRLCVQVFAIISVPDDECAPCQGARRLDPP